MWGAGQDEAADEFVTQFVPQSTFVAETEAVVAEAEEVLRDLEAFLNTGYVAGIKH